jgi:glycosyltransferase involved in cell wall biosynthesis
MILGIDGSNLRGGGGVTHITGLLEAADPLSHGFSTVILWGGNDILGRIPNRPWLKKTAQGLLDRSLPYRIFWQRYRLSTLAKEARCDLLFVPGGSYMGDFGSVAAMCRNMLPFEPKELRRYGCSLTRLRLMLLRLAQTQTFKKAAGVIFLSQYARDSVIREIGAAGGDTTIIPHGVDYQFSCPPRKQLPIECYSSARPFNVIYVSIVDMYKHQWAVAEAVAQLRNKGIPVALTLVGWAYPRALARLQKTVAQIDPSSVFVRYLGHAPYSELAALYRQADLCVFASSCENMPNILLESMASGLPIACSDRGPMPEVLGAAGVYFDPENPDDIAHSLQRMLDSPDLRTKLAQDSFQRAQAFSWRRCAKETFGFLAKVASAQAQKSMQMGQA